MTDSLEEVSQFIYNWLKDNKDSLSLTDVWYGDVDSVPRTPAVSVEPTSKRRQLTETGHQVTNTFIVTLMLFHSKLVAPSQQMREAILKGEEIESFLDSNRKLDGLLIHSYVTSIESGFTRRNRAMYKVALLSWEGISKTRLL